MSSLYNAYDKDGNGVLDKKEVTFFLKDVIALFITSYKEKEKTGYKNEKLLVFIIIY